MTAALAEKLGIDPLTIYDWEPLRFEFAVKAFQKLEDYRELNRLKHEKP